jgi:hypothetical protein
VKEEEHFYLKDNARPPSEAELRKKLTPGMPAVHARGPVSLFQTKPAIQRHANTAWPAEEVCTLEACYVAAFRMKHRGLLLHDKLDKAAVRQASRPLSTVRIAVVRPGEGDGRRPAALRRLRSCGWRLKCCRRTSATRRRRAWLSRPCR